MNDEILSVAEFCQEFRISRDCFYARLREGTGPRIMKIGRRTLIRRDSALAWAENLERQSAAALA